MRHKWIVVASRTIADIYTFSPDGEELVPVEHLEHPEGRLHAEDFDADRPGRAFDSVGGGRHAMGPEVSPTAHQAEVFAGEIAARISAARCRNELSGVLLIAEPTFLGRLRAALDDESAELVTATMDKGLTNLPAPELMKRLHRMLYTTRHV